MQDAEGSGGPTTSPTGSMGAGDESERDQGQRGHRRATPPPLPMVLGPNRPRQFYRGTGALASFTGHPSPDEFRPEDWLASTTSRFGRDVDGQTLMADGRWLGDVFADDPVEWFGPEHVQHFGSDPALLVKLLDAGQRLPVHLHPTRSFASNHLGSHYGKTEAWVVVDAPGGVGEVWLGFRRNVEADELRGWVNAQAVDVLLESMNKVSLKTGDAILVPAGTPHAIGAGLFCVELQEPTDFSLNLEWAGFDLPSGDQGQLGMSPELVLEAVHRRALSETQLKELATIRAEAPVSGGAALEWLFPAAADQFFRAQRIDLRQSGMQRWQVAPSFALLVGLEGEGSVTTETGVSSPLKRGTVMICPWSAGTVTLEGPVQVLRCLPPLAPAGPGRSVG
jgi:mannose-6-phosphate isomerase